MFISRVNVKTHNEFISFIKCLLKIPAHVLANKLVLYKISVISSLYSDCCKKKNIFISLKTIMSFYTITSKIKFKK